MFKHRIREVRIRPPTLVLVGMLAGTVLFSGVASAATIEATFDGVSPGKSFQYKLGDASAPTKTTTAGKFNWTRTGGTWAFDPLGVFHTFCIELVQNIAPSSSYTYDVILLQNAPIPDDAPLGGPMGITKANYIKELWLEQVLAGDMNDADHVAAIQVAFWEVVYDDDLSLSGATGFRAVTSAGFVTTAQTWLDSLGDPFGNLNIHAMASTTHQDQAFLSVTGTSEEIPVPAALAMGLPALGLIGRRRLT